MFLPNWRKGLNSSFTNRAVRRRTQKRAARVQILEARSLLSVTPVGATIAPIETLAFTGTVATFTATDAGPFTATIDWGDGSTSAGTISQSTGGAFKINGAHTYAQEGFFPLS
ncbi:MAG TPA: hypothetical protein VN699_07860, partial [Pirellulales bacterium]|nr:hypothetical protein [Pirellulales bacterium]